jgi:hypothetical protein
VPSLDTTESLVIHGANGVSQPPRPSWPWLSLGAVLLLAVVLRRTARKPSQHRTAMCAALAMVLAGASMPGLWQVFVARADAPLKRTGAAAVIVQTLSELKQIAPWPAAVAVSHEDDDVMFPLTRYAVPTRQFQKQPVLTLETYGTTLRQRCTLESVRAVCRPVEVAGDHRP